MSPRLRIELFDGLRLVYGGETITQFRTQKTASLLAYLAYFERRHHRRETLLELLWPECGRPAASKSLSTALWSLRGQLEALGLPAATVLHANRSAVWLDADHIATDAAEFQTTLRVAHQVDDRDERALLLTSAVSLYRGELLRGHYEDWIFPEQTRLASLYQSALNELCDLLEASGELNAALRHAGLAVAADPLSQAARARLMRLYAALGQPAAALTHYHELGRVLKRDLEGTPGAAIRDLAREIAAGRYAPAVHPETPTPLAQAAPTGERRLVEPVPEPVGGAVPPDSSLYVVRASDAKFQAAVARRDSIVLVKGPRQTGKTSLLARGLRQARVEGARVAFIDLRSLTPNQVASLDAFYLALAEALAEQLDLSVLPHTTWSEGRGPSLSLRRYLRREVLPALQAPLVWTVDEVDRLFEHSFFLDAFALFRSWHNERAVEPEGPWVLLTLVLAYSTEAHLYVADLDQSPFNVGTRVELEDFRPEQVAELNFRYGSPLKSPEEVERFVALVCGQPYLTRRGLAELAEGRTDLAAMEAASEVTGPPFADHLRRILVALTRDAALCDIVRDLLRATRRPDEDSFYRLRSAGLLAGATPDDARLRCRLYESYLARHLL